MRRFRALVRSAALEALSDPLSSVLFLAALLAVPLLPVFHCHQFGEPGRLPRECGFSAMLVFGIVFATASAVRVIGGEISSGTAAAALARAVPRSLFFCAKITGVLLAFAVFAMAVSLSTLVSVAAAEAGEIEASAHGGIRIWMPGLASSVLCTLAGFALAAAANRFFRARFCAGACMALALAQIPPLAVAVLLSPAEVSWRLVPAMGVLAVACGVFIVLAGALAVWMPAAFVTAGISIAVLSSFVWPVRALVPDIQRFWLVDAYSGGNVPSVGILASAFAAGALLIVFWMVVGSVLLERRELP